MILQGRPRTSIDMSFDNQYATFY